jgi:uncharacterized protein
MRTQAVLIVFAKAPVAGKVKTRLIPALGRQGATSLYEDLLTRTLSTAIKADFSEIQIWVSGNINHRYFSRLKNRHYVKLYQQRGKNLGQRMSNAFDSVLRKHSYAVLIGSDCPSLLSSDLQSGMDFLENGKDVVIGPAKDGGYYLIGLKRNDPELFSDIKWGEETVFSETCKRIEKVNLNMGLLLERTDVDRTSDLDSYFRMKKQESALYFRLA